MACKRIGETRQDMASCYQNQEPYFSFGVIADIQYADRDDGLSGWRTMRYYRQSCLHLRSAIEQWNAEVTLPKFVLQLGDIIDGSNNRLFTSQKSLDAVLNEIKNANMPFHHIWGNHEFYNFNRDYLRDTKLNTTWMQDKLQDSENEASHGGSPDGYDYYAYHFSPCTKFRFILIDTYDLSVLGRSKDCPVLQESVAFLDGGYLTNSNGSDERHLQEFNGGMGREQLAWLDNVLTYSDQNNERVIIAGHIPIHPAAKRSYCLAWNYDDILKVIRSHECVVCYLAGHDHSGGYYLDSHGIHHITMEGVIESPPGTNAFGTVYVYEDFMVLRGSGRVKERLLPYRRHTQKRDDCFKCSCSSTTGEEG
ncbi:manganese-dependent ADP-ribose/CDP-alcohol diphosphatase-like [Mixophyes fleayi]|uniref:manganese-dependent ADP-ribose/CDP-alcohol diphosphatase-like n=1 Tax=Mixophyes fleayi TaxID=3061075 RepID=UPI003F4E3BDD